MSPVYDVLIQARRDEALEAAAAAVGSGRLVVLPTDTVYGVGADPFNPAGVAALLSAKGRGRDKPPAVLVPNPATIEGLAMNVPSYARRLVEAFWPGALTLIFRAQPSLMWDLGDTNGTIGLRMPDDPVALALLERTGPMAVSSANRTGEPTATTITEAGFAFGPAVEVYLDDGMRAGGVPSTIIDCTKADPVVLRQGNLSVGALRRVLGPIDLVDSTGARIAPDVTPEPQTSIGAAFTPQEPRSEQTIVRPWAEDAPPGIDRDAATQALPSRGVGAEPPFERYRFNGFDLPGRTTPPNG